MHTHTHILYIYIYTHIKEERETYFFVSIHLVLASHAVDDIMMHYLKDPKLWATLAYSLLWVAQDLPHQP